MRAEISPIRLKLTIPASGTALLQDIQDTRIVGFPWPIGVKPTGDKVIRLSNHSALIEAGHVYLPQQAAWLGDFKAEFMAFPQSRHDDQVDSVSQYLTWVVDRNRNTMTWGTF